MGDIRCSAHRYTYKLSIAILHVGTRDHMSKSSRWVICKLEADGWFEVAQSGSHKQFRHAVKPGRVTVPHPVKDLNVKTLKSIEKQSGVDLS